MSSRRDRSFRMLSGGRGWAVLLLVWLVAEIAAFAAVVAAVGLSGAMLIGLATSLGGAILMRRLGRSAATQLRMAARGGPVRLAGPGVTDGLLQALAALLLILPGFLSDAVGAGLALAPVRSALRTRLGGPAARRPGGIVDLRPDDWHRD